MKIIKISLISVLGACLFAPISSHANSYDSAVKEATASINAAKAVNYEWRDSRKLLKKADKLKKEGKNKKAMKLVSKAKQQGELAVAQAELQSGVNGPHK